MSIYPYVYVCTHKITNQIYIGARCANHVPAHQDLGTYYFTSSKNVKPIFNEFDWEIIFEGTREEVFQLESDLIRQHWRQPYLLNKNCGGEKFNCTHHSNETKQKMSESKKGEKCYLYNKKKENHPKYNKNSSNETKQKMSESKKGENNPLFGKIPWNKGKSKSEEHKQKLKKPKVKIICPHCGKEGGSNALKRYHFENCKQKKGP